MDASNNPLTSQWIQKYGQNYVAHATKNYADVFKNKALKCAEEVLRSQGQVEHESMGFAQRGVTNIESMTGSKVLPWLALDRISKKTQNLVEVCIFPKFSEKPFLKKEYNPKRFKVEDCGEFWKVKLIPDSKDNYKPPFPKKFPRTMQTNWSEQAAEATTLGDDEIKGRPIDKQLRKIYEYCLKKGVAPSNLVESVSNMRAIALETNPHRLGDDIAVAKNDVWWSYGPIAIIMGNPLSKVAKPDKFETGKDSEEFRLKKPFQIVDGFYQEVIDSEENIILGPKNLLDQYRENLEISDSVKARFVDIESLSKEQWPIFGLDENIVKAICSPKEKT